MPECDDHRAEAKGIHAVSIAARIATMALSVASAALMATASQCTIAYPYAGVPQHAIGYGDFGPFVYLVAANATAACLEAAAIFLSVWTKGGRGAARLLLPVLDAAVPALLYSSTGAALAAGDLLTYCGPDGRRVSICTAGGGGGAGFCGQVHLSMYTAIAAAVAATATELAKSVPLSLSLGGSECDSDSGCGHACGHHKH